MNLIVFKKYIVFLEGTDIPPGEHPKLQKCHPGPDPILGPQPGEDRFGGGAEFVQPRGGGGQPVRSAESKLLRVSD